ncbi:germ cell nuclear acidic protein-like [Chironomus tepperi]|uniref:germ cell nuclear acidic protein-like n=1 Tax=Chironomus tepperi TaxID=113505 RepID=UPI00391F19ED
MSGFFSGYKPNIKKVQKPYGNLKLRKKLEINECTDNPPLRRSSFLTDDESEKDFQHLDYSTNIDNKKMTEQNFDQENKENDRQIADTVIDSMYTRMSGINVGLSKERISENKENNRQIADTVIDSMCTRVSGINVGLSKERISENKENNRQIADTVIDTMCTRVSGINVGISESLEFESEKKTPADTVIDSQNSSRALQEIDVPLPSRRSLFRTRKDSLSSDELMGVKNVRSPKPQVMDSSEDEVIHVLDTDDEQEISILEPAEINSQDSYVNCSSAAGTLNDFFNNPPLLPSNVGVTHAMVKPHHVEQDRSISKSIPVEVGYKSSNETSRQSQGISDSSKSSSFLDNDVEIGPTDESDIENDDIVDLTLDDSGPKPKAKQNYDKLTATKSNPISVNVETQTPESSKRKHRNIANINIKFDLKISIRDGSASEDSDDEASQSNSSENCSVKGDYLKAISAAPNIEPKSPDEDKENSMQEVYNTPKHINEDMPVIDKELQSMLHDLYGNDWKTPQVMSGFKIKKFRDELRKSLAANNFESFVGNLADDLESTRISPPKPKSKIIENKPLSYSNKKDENVKKTPSSKPKTPSRPLIKDNESSKKKIGSAIKATESAIKSVPKTPLHLLCDPDTESEEEESSSNNNTDDDYNPDDTWNASSDEEYQSEKDRIKKRQSIKQSDLIFTLDNSLDEILKKYEFKPQPQIESVEKPIRRKLFTHSHFDEDVENVTPKKGTPKTPIKSQTDLNIPKTKESDKKKVTVKDPKKTPTTAGKGLKVFGSTPKNIGSSPKVPNLLTKTPSLIDNLTKKEALKRFSKFSFLKSLDAEANKVLCDPDALYYRENYKTKKHELADKLFKLYNEKVFNSQLTDVPIKWNKKLQTTGGRCNNSRRAGIRNSLVELSDKVLTSADRLRCTLIHEMCHAAAWILNGENGHGATWKKWTAKANSIFPELPKITVCHSYVIEYKYTYLCMNCKARSQAHSKTKKVEEIRCSLCKGSIQLFENKKNKDGVLELVPFQRKEPTAFAKFVKLKFKEVKKPHLSHKEVMQLLSAQFASLDVQEKAQL